MEFTAVSEAQRGFVLDDTHKVVVALGGRGCIARGTRIEDASTGAQVPVEEIEGPFLVWALNGDKVVRTIAGKPILKGTELLHRVELESGQAISVTGQHRFLTPSGWQTTDHLGPGDEIAAVVLPACSPLLQEDGVGDDQYQCFAYHRQSNSGTYLQVHPLDDDYLPRRDADSQSRYWRGFRPYGGQPQMAGDTDLSAPPLLSDAPVHSRGDLRTGGRDFSTGRNRPYLSFARPSIDGSPTPPSLRRSLCAVSQTSASSAGLAHPSGPVPSLSLRTHGDGSAIDTVSDYASIRVSAASQPHSSYPPPTKYTAGWGKIASITPTHQGDYYDLHVPIYNNYLAEGVFHHNSGKTHCAVAKTIGMVMRYPGSSIWFVAPDETRLDQGLLNKFRELCPRSLLVKEWRGRKQYFQLANGSEIHWRSTNTQAGLRAGEQNFAVFDEAAWSPYSQAKSAIGDLWAGLRLKVRELWCPNEWVFDYPWIQVLERTRTRSRIRVTYKRQMAITTTPAVSSYINEILEGGDPEGFRTYYLKTVDNAEHLPEGYLEQLKEAYPGIIYRQEALGELIGVEIALYPMFDSTKHVMYPPVDFKLVVGGIDWGYTNNLAIVVYGFSSSGVAFGCEEFVVNHAGNDKLILKCDEIRRKWNVERFFCDPAEPKSIQDLNIHGIPASKANITDRVYRASRVASRLEKTDANTYRLYLSPDMKETIRAFRFSGDKVEDPRKLKETKSGRPGDDPLDATEYAITGGEMLLGGNIGTFLGRDHKRHAGNRPAPVGVPFRLI